jgi:DNA topoisomerase-3
MESAGKTVEDDELREAMQEKGLGTPATRSSIIEGLIAE